MPRINSTKFGNVIIDDKIFHQVLIISDAVKERNTEKLEKLFGTTHEIGDWEIEELLAGKPEIIIIGTGQSGAMQVSQEIKEKLESQGAEIILAITPEAIQIYNEKVQEGKKVNALIHTTC